MSTEFRFPTVPAFPGVEYGRDLLIPVMPRSSIFQTVKEDLDMLDIEDIMTRPKWDFEEANLRLFKEKKAREAAEMQRVARGDAVRAKKPLPKRPTPKRKPGGQTGK